MDFYGMNGFQQLFADYAKYAREAELNGKKPASLLQFAMGNF